MENTDNFPGGGASTPSSGIDRASYDALLAEKAELEQWRNEAQGTFDALQPHAARIRKMVEDEQYAQMFDDTVASYEAIRKRAKPQLSDEWNPEVNPYIKKIDDLHEKVSKFAESAQTYEKQQVEAVNRQLLQENTRISQQLIDKYPHLAENDYAGIHAIAAYGIQNKIPFGAAAEKMEPLYRRDASEPNLRPDMGAPGIPGQSEKGDNVDMVTRAAELIREHQARGREVRK